MINEQDKQDARAGGYTVSLVGKTTYDTYVVYHHGSEKGEFALLEDAWNHAISLRQAELHNH